MDDGRGFGPPHERRGTARRVVVPYGWLRRAAAIALASGAQRSVCASGCEGGVGIDARTIPKGGPPPRPPRQRLAKRKARKEQLVKFDLCPIPSECSTAHKVRKSQHGHARVLVGAALIGQDSLAPRPAARQGASRARNCAATSVFSFDGSTAVFFLGRQKENGGGIPAGDAPLPPVWGMKRERKLSFLSLLFPQRAAKVRAPAVFSQWSRNAAAAARITV